MKTGHARYPKAFLEEKMKEWPGGSHLVLETTTPEGVKLFAVGYKYCKKKCLCFLFTEGASWTEQGEPYKARFQDNNGNSMIRDVLRPACCSHYFKISNVIDVHNQQRQKELRLEKMWVTQDGFFRLITTIFGICVVDCWFAYKHHLAENHRHKNCDLISFTNMMAKDLLDNEEKDMIEVDSLSLCIEVTPVQDITTSPCSTRVSQLTNRTNSSSLEIRNLKICLEVESHKLVPCEDKTDAKRPGKNQRTGRKVIKMRKRTKRGDCFECKKMNKEKVKRVKYYCPECVAPMNSRFYWLCHDCHTDHKNRIRSELLAST